MVETKRRGNEREIPEKSSGKTTIKHRRNNNGVKKLLSKLRMVVRNYVEGQRERRKQGWKAGGE